MNKLIFKTAFFVITILSCQKAVNVTIPYDGDKLVVRSLIESNNLIYVNVSKSAQTSAGLNVLPDSVRVQLWENNQFKENLTPIAIPPGNKIYYTSTSLSNTNSTYTIKASAKNLKSVEGTDAFTSRPQFSLSSYKLISSSNNESSLRVEINDAGNEQNYYLVRVFNADSIRTSGGTVILPNRKEPLAFTIDNASETDIFGDARSDTYFILEDSKFNGKSFQFSAQFFENYQPSPNNNRYKAVVVSGISLSTYRYFKSQLAAETSNGNPFAEVVNIHSNVNGGFGIVGCINDNLATVRRSN